MKIKSFLFFIPAALMITFLIGLTYTAVQQDMRQGANDPQIQLAEDLAAALAHGQSIASLNQPTMMVDVVHSLAPFIVVYDETGKVTFSTGVLNDKAPTVPRGVFDFTKMHGEDRVTWQPQPNVRIATVIVHYQTQQTSGFVLAGRSLREVERREDALTRQVQLAWLASMAVTLITWLFCVSKSKTK